MARRLKLPIHDEGEISGVGGRHRAWHLHRTHLCAEARQVAVSALHRRQAARRRAVASRHPRPRVPPPVQIGV
ncbi:hypothetical protein [Phenylobacterium sp.]|uniref:hypothetical protein n=1 Tax=Phenylobacterium sp. TaxID=1871053 RepID=UPI0039C953E8